MQQQQLFRHGIKYSYFSVSVVTEKIVGFVENYCFSLVQFLNVLEFGTKNNLVVGP